MLVALKINPPLFDLLSLCRGILIVGKRLTPFSRARDLDSLYETRMVAKRVTSNQLGYHGVCLFVCLILRSSWDILFCFPAQEDGLNEVHDKIAQEMPFPERRLRGVFEELGQGCSKFVSLVKGTTGRTRLDKERKNLLVREMVNTTQNLLFFSTAEGCVT